MRLILNDGYIELKILYKTLYPKIRVYVLQNSGSEAEAKDIFQEALSAAWVNYKLGNFAGNASNFEAYIYSIAKNKWLDMLKSSNKRSTERLLSPVEKENEIYQEVDTRSLISAVEQLGKNCQAILRLFYFEQKNFKDIGKKMGYSAEVMKTKKYRCMQKLREIYLKK